MELAKVIVSLVLVVFQGSFGYPNAKENIPGVSKKYPVLAGNRNETIGYYYSPSRQINLSVFNLDSHTLH